MNKAVLLPIVVLIWGGFLGLLGFLLSAQLMRAGIRRRMQDALTVKEEDLDDDVAKKERAAEMNRSLATRVLTPIIKKLGAASKASARGAKGDMVKEMLQQAGNPMGMGYAEFMGLKSFTFLLFTGIGIFTCLIAVPPLLELAAPGQGSDPMMKLMGSAIWVMVFAFMGFSGPTFWLRRTVNKRLKKIRKAMADVVDLIVLAIEAGLGFDMAVGQAVEKTTGPLTDELSRVLDEVRVGRPQGDAFRAMATRIKMQELSLLVAAIDQAMKMGIGLGSALRLQATEIRERRMAFIKEQAGKLPVKMMLPLVLFIFPALFVVILGPAFVQFMQMSASGELPS